MKNLFCKVHNKGLSGNPTFRSLMSKFLKSGTADMWSIYLFGNYLRMGFEKL